MNSDKPYRNNICCLVFKDNKFLLIQNKGWAADQWKFPQGGIDDGETLEVAASRELQEELGTNKFKIIGRSIYTNQYDWDDKSLKLAGYKWRGQIQYYLVAEFLGNDSDIKINPEETNNYKWVELKDLWNNIDHQDKNFTNYASTIKKVLEEFNLYASKS